MGRPSDGLKSFLLFTWNKRHLTALSSMHTGGAGDDKKDESV